MNFDRVNGYVSFKRNQLIKSPWYFKEKFSEERAWEFLLTFARFKDDIEPLEGIGLILKKHQLAISQSNLAEIWGWGSRTSVYRFLNELQVLGYIKFNKWPDKGVTKTTLITILVYELFVYRPEANTGKSENPYTSQNKQYQQKQENIEKGLNTGEKENQYTNKNTIPIKKNNYINNKENKLLSDIIEWLKQSNSYSLKDKNNIQEEIRRHGFSQVRFVFEKYKKKYPSCEVYHPYYSNLRPRLEFFEDIESIGKAKNLFNSFT